MTATGTDDERLAALTRVGLSWRPSGQLALRGPLLRLAESCDRALARLAGIWDAEEERHPAALRATDVQPSGYLRSFPHQATFMARLHPEESNLDNFLDGPVLGPDGHVALTELAPVTEILTPAACYHLYSGHRGETLTGPRCLTTRNTCFRQEERYVPLRRLSSFTMREIVCIGSPAETVAFLTKARTALDMFCELIDLPLDWRVATDPFFRPESSPGHLLQRLEPVKHEGVYGSDLAISSLNRHHDHFGAAFGLTRDDRPAHSCCLAFGIERWLYAITDRHGTEPADWPALEQHAADVRTTLWGGAA
ncbi:hypothetical protein [Streptomyces gobiensis]|uniref:hypothetical protein n=1 Tax=Streptomyces gobiensis TaxID=2875706 RepID=UPI001E29E266|nr:hypothetical protein [Streptomyces gobiensis]UGY91466.1 hypothetical protein test1122_06865 [Streptomyces gobiensis]